MAKKKISFIVGALGLQVLRILEKSKNGLTVNQVAEKAGALASTTENHMRRFVALGLVDNTQKAPTKEPRRGQPERLYVWLGREYEVTDLDDHHQSLKSAKTLAKEARKAAKASPKAKGPRLTKPAAKPEPVKKTRTTPGHALGLEPTGGQGSQEPEGPRTTRGQEGPSTGRVPGASGLERALPSTRAGYRGVTPGPTRGI